MTMKLMLEHFILRDYGLVQCKITTCVLLPGCDHSTQSLSSSLNPPFLNNPPFANAELPQLLLH